MVARWAHNPKVVGSSPTSATKRAGFLRLFLFMYWVYILYSEPHKKTYTGFTSNFGARFTAHNELGIKGFTKNFRPWILILKEEFENKSEAMKREKYFKSGVGRNEIKRILEAKFIK